MLDSNAQVHTPYGATEALPVTTISSRELLTLPTGICVGRPVPGVEVHGLEYSQYAIDHTMESVKDGEVDVPIEVKGPALAVARLMEYAVAPELADQVSAT